jgi:hypothetical protein
MPDKVTLIREWLVALAVLCRTNVGKEELAATLNAYAPMLAARYSLGAFSQASLDAVATQCSYFPSYAELCGALSPWWQEHRDTEALQIASDQPATVRQREIDQAVRDSWRNITAENVRAKVRAVQDSPMPPALGAFLATALRKHAPQHLGLLPPKWLAERPGEPADVVALRSTTP